MALRFQGDNPNILTKTMYLLLHNQVGDAEKWVASNEGDTDHETAAEMLSNYKTFGSLWAEEGVK